METPKQQTLENAIKLAGEVLLPGASLLMDGKVVLGGAHVVLGAWAKTALGPVGVALVIANSYTESTTGMNLIKHVSKFAQDMQANAPSPEAKGQT